MPSSEEYEARKSSGKLKSRYSRSHREYKGAEPSRVVQGEAVERPATVEDLRKARLSYIDTPAAERHKKMKYEYVKTIPVKAKISRSDGRSRHTSSVLSKAKSDTERRKKRRKIRNEEVPVIDAQDDQYVYRRDRVEAQVSHEDTRIPGTMNKESTRTRKRRSDKDGYEQPRMVRRHTMPTQDRGPGETVDARTLATSRPPLRKSATAAPIPLRPSHIRTNTSDEARTQVSMGRSTATSSSKKPSSVLGSLFASRPAPLEKKVSCLTCGDDVPVHRSAKLPCTHRMCHSCLKRIFKLSMTDPAHMPPRCCTDRHIDVKHVDLLFDHDFKKTWNHKFKEYKAKNRIYCPRRGCSQWIQPKHISIDNGRKVGKCPTCKTYVCGICSQKMHKSKDCPKDPATKEFVEVAKKQGWQKCYSCSAMVELKEGCNHMTCRCTAEFCMVCGGKWKSCDCPWFSYTQVDVLGNPVRFQEEMDRRRDQVLRDEELARRMEGLEVTTADADGILNIFGMGNRAMAAHMNANFIQQARDALTANYQQADNVARGLLNGLFLGGGGRENATLPDPAEQQQQQRQQPVTMTTATGVPVIRHRTRRRRSTLQDLSDDRVQTAAERDQARRMRNWADQTPPPPA